MAFYVSGVINNYQDYTGRLISIITLIIILWPIMSTGSFVKNWMGVSSFAIGHAISINKKIKIR